jgi:hypothetical protein
VVTPTDCSSCDHQRGRKEQQNGQHAQGSARSAPGERQGPSEGTASSGPASSSAARLIRQLRLNESAERDVEGVVRAYPGLYVRATPAVIWMKTWIRPVEDLADSALLVSRYPLAENEDVRIWAWWRTGVWVGPRHTYKDGSICAFEVSHGIWTRQDPLWKFFDLAAVWLTRHLHLLAYGRWPGRQIIHTPVERLVEQQPGELCGCDSGRGYDDCHRSLDRAAVPAQEERRFRFIYPTLRAPSPDVREFVAGRI